MNGMSEQPPLVGILETVLYCDSSNEEAVRRFYEDVMGFHSMAVDFGYRVGSEGDVFLLFNSDKTRRQGLPHGATGKGHCCFTAAPGAYETWKNHLVQRNVDVTDEIRWDNGIRSLYFEDPAGNVLEIAEGDLWPRD